MIIRIGLSMLSVMLIAYCLLECLHFDAVVELLFSKVLVEESHSEVHCPCHLRKKIFITTQLQPRLLIVFSTWVEVYNHNTTLPNECCNFRIYAKFH